jgi:hypothetical protein
MTMTTFGGPVRVAARSAVGPVVVAARGVAVRFVRRFAGVVGSGIRSGVSGELTAEA